MVYSALCIPTGAAITGILLEEAGMVSKTQLTQFDVQWHLGIETFPSCSPEAQGRIERAFRTHQDRLPRELAARW